MLKRFNMADAKEKKTPMDTKCHLQLNPKGIDVDQKLYRPMIGSLLSGLREPRSPVPAVSGLNISHHRHYLAHAS